MGKPIVSVIMAVHNAEKYLDKSIQSILNQTFRDLELVIVNDFSTDNSDHIIKSYSKKDRRIKYISLKKNIGAAGARNCGLKKAKGKYIAILDADDVAIPDRLRIQYKFLEDNPTVFLVGGMASIIDMKGRRLRNIENPCSNKDICKELLKRNPICHVSIMMRNISLRYREKFLYSHDYDLMLRIASQDLVMRNIPDILVCIGQNPEGISIKKAVQQKILACIALKMYLERKKTGKDAYSRFEPTTLLQHWEKEKNSPVIVQALIDSSISLNDSRGIKKNFHKQLVHNPGSLTFRHVLAYAAAHSNFFLLKRIYWLIQRTVKNIWR